MTGAAAEPRERLWRKKVDSIGKSDFEHKAGKSPFQREIGTAINWLTTQHKPKPRVLAWKPLLQFRTRQRNVLKPVELPNPLELVLASAPDEVSRFSVHAVQWLEQQDERHRQLWLNRFARHVKQLLAEATRSRDPNVVASIEILARCKHDSAPSLAETYLRLPPSQYHLYALPIYRVVAQNDPALRANCADIASAILESRFGAGVDGDIPWNRQLIVECFRTLRALAPSMAVEAGARHLLCVGDVELTAALEDVTASLRGTTCTPAVQEALRTTAWTLWERYTAGGELAVNPHGILARLIELLGRADEPHDKIMELMKQSLAPSQVAFLFAQRPLAFLTSTERKQLYSTVLSSLIRNGHRMAVKKIIDTVSSDPGVELLDVIRNVDTD